MQSHQQHPDPEKSETLGVGPNNLSLRHPLGDYDTKYMLKFEYMCMLKFLTWKTSRKQFLIANMNISHLRITHIMQITKEKDQRVKVK